MREDMASVVTERPRVGGGIQYPKGEKRRNQKIALEELPKSEKIRQKWQSNHSNYVKEFTDVLGPMYRFLLSQVGKPWDDVWSEICEKLPNNSLNTSHVRQHVLDFVITKIIIVDDKICHGDGRYYGEEIENYRGNEWQMYVHPITGILSKLKAASYRHRDKDKVGIDIPGDVAKQYHKIDNVWYVVTLVEYPEIEKKTDYHRPRKVYDHAYKVRFTKSDLLEKYGRYAYAVSKSQLNSKEIDRANLR